MSKSVISYGLIKKSGRNHQGRITVRGRGGGFRLLFRNIDYYRNTFYITYTMQGFFYDSRKKSKIAVIVNHKKCQFMLKPVDFSIGSQATSFHGRSNLLFFKVGSSYILRHLPIGALIHNVSRYPQSKGIISRSNGTFCQIIFKNKQKVILKLPSKKLVSFSIFCRATYGVVDYIIDSIKFKKNAGWFRNYGYRPKVRGVAINPTDHPHGGGEGKGSVARKQSVTPWARAAKGKKY